MQPNMSDKCLSCSHDFKKHFVNFGGDASGCSVVHQTGYQMDPITSLCFCKGFAVRYTPEKLIAYRESQGSNCAVCKISIPVGDTMCDPCLTKAYYEK